MSRRELQILSNCFQDSDTRYLQVHYPFFDLRLFTLDVKKPELKSIVKYEDFDRARLERKPLDRSLNSDEVPLYSDLKNCMLSSGFLRFKNHGEVASRLVRMREEAMDPNLRSKPFFVAVDTNVLYHRFLSRHLPITDEQSGKTVNARDFRYVLSEIVRIEIDSRITHKYSGGEIRKLQELFAHKELLDEFKNASGRRGRMAKLALNEMDYLMSDLRALRIKGTPIKGKELNDIEIAQSYKRWAREGDFDVLLITADEDMISHARTSELMTLQLEMPFDMPEHGRLHPWAISDLLYDLAITFGAVSIDNTGTTIMGEWGGKSSTDYSREHIKVMLEDEGAADKVASQQALCRSFLG